MYMARMNDVEIFSNIHCFHSMWLKSLHSFSNIFLFEWSFLSYVLPKIKPVIIYNIKTTHESYCNCICVT